MDPDTKHSRLTIALAVIVTTLVAGVALVVATSSSDAKAGGGAGFSCKVAESRFVCDIPLTTGLPR